MDAARDYGGSRHAERDPNHGAQIGLIDSPETFDADTLADWIAGECFGSQPEPIAPPLDHCTAEDFTHLSVPALMAIALDRGQMARTRCAALEVIDDRFIKDTTQ